MSVVASRNGGLPEFYDARWPAANHRRSRLTFRSRIVSLMRFWSPLSNH